MKTRIKTLDVDFLCTKELVSKPTYYFSKNNFDKFLSMFLDYMLDTMKKLDNANISMLSFESTYRNYKPIDSNSVMKESTGNLFIWLLVN